MNVVLAVGWEVVVDDKRDLLDIDTASQQVSSNQNTTWPGAELAHDDISILLFHFAVLTETKKGNG